MKITVEDQSSVKKVLHIEVPQEQVANELNNAYGQLKKTAKIKGFRPGKAPRSVLEGIYRKDVNADVCSKLIQQAVFEAIKENELKIVGSPKVDPPDLDPKGAYAFDATVEVRPEIADIDYKGLALTKNKHTISDEEIDMQIKMLRQNLAQRKKIDTDRPLQTGDLAVVDYEGFQDDKPHPETEKTENFTVKVGEGQIIEDFDDGLIGMQVDEEKEIQATFPQDYFNKELAGEDILFKVKLNEIREEILPELNDDFAKQVSDQFESMDVLKDKIRENLQNGYQKRVEQELNEQVFKQLIEQSDFELPETLVDSELEHIIKDAERSFEQSNRSMEEAGLSKEKLAEQYRPTAEKQVRRHLILSKLIEQEKLELSDGELDQGFQEMADNYRQPVEHIKGYYSQNQEGLTFFKHALLEKKALKIIIDNGNVTETDPADKDAESAPSAKESS